MRKVLLCLFVIVAFLLTAGPVLAAAAPLNPIPNAKYFNTYDFTRPDSIDFQTTTNGSQFQVAASGLTYSNGELIQGNAWISSRSLGTIQEDVHLAVNTVDIHKYTYAWYPYFDYDVEYINRYKAKFDVVYERPDTVRPPKEAVGGTWTEIGKVK